MVLAEVVWYPIKDWEGFKERLHALTKRYDVLGLNYATHVFDNKAKANLEPDEK